MQDFRVPVTEVAGRPGAGRDVSVKAPLHGAATPLVTLRDDVPVVARLTLDGVVEGVVVTGVAEGRIEAKCARCLKPVDTTLAVDVTELFVRPGHEAVAGDEDDFYRIEGTEIDLEPMLRDALVLAMPLNPVCREDCKGLCPRCGRDWNEGQCDCTESEVDPRWAALDEVRARLEAS